MLIRPALKQALALGFVGTAMTVGTASSAVAINIPTIDHLMFLEPCDATEPSPMGEAACLDGWRWQRNHSSQNKLHSVGSIGHGINNMQATMAGHLGMDPLMLSAGTAHEINADLVMLARVKIHPRHFGGGLSYDGMNGLDQDLSALERLMFDHVVYDQEPIEPITFFDLFAQSIPHPAHQPVEDNQPMFFRKHLFSLATFGEPPTM